MLDYKSINRAGPCQREWRLKSSYDMGHLNAHVMLLCCYHFALEARLTEVILTLQVLFGIGWGFHWSVSSRWVSL